MRRICISALLMGACSAPAFADPLQVTFSPYVMSQPVQQPGYAAQPQAPAGQQYAAGQPYYVYAAPQRYAAPAPVYTGTVAPPRYASAAPSYAAPAPVYTGTVAPRYASAAPPSYAAPAPAPLGYVEPAPPPQPAPANPGRGLFGGFFGGPTLPARGYQPALPDYQSAPAPQPTVINAPQAYAPSSQGNMAAYQVDPKFDRQVVDYRGEEKPGTVVIDTPNKFLYLVEDNGKALRYGIGVGRPGFTWAGEKTITAKREWPDWRPPSDMLARRPDLPRFMPGGIDNPLGARAMYLGSTLYRIHGSNEPWTIGTNVSSGCIRMRNEDVTDLYERVKIGTKVLVL